AFTPEDRAAMAFDGNPQTAWTVSAFSVVAGQWIQKQLDKPVTTNSLTLVQPFFLNPNRWISKVTVTFDGKRSLTLNLSKASRTQSGEKITFPSETFSTLRVTIDATVGASGAALSAASGVGFAEIGVP